MSDVIENKVAKSGLISLDLAEYRPSGERILLDIAPNLYEGIVLKEKDFRLFIKETDWSIYAGKNVAIICSEDAIVPTWAYMLLSSVITPHALEVFFGTLDQMEVILFEKSMLKAINPSEFNQTRVVVKGCGDVFVPTSAFVSVVKMLQPYVKSIMYGEPCSTVPVYKEKKIR